MTVATTRRTTASGALLPLRVSPKTGGADPENPESLAGCVERPVAVRTAMQN
jgi:hypothetical protein